MVALAGTGVLGVSERPCWSFLCPGPPARPREGTLDSHRNGAGTFISGEQAGTRVGGQASCLGASPRPRSWTSARLPGSREPPSTVATCPRHSSRPGPTSIPCPAASPEPGPAGALEGGSRCPPHGLIHAPAIHGDHVVGGHVLDEELLPPQGRGAPPAAQRRGPGALLAPQAQELQLPGSSAQAQ